MTRAQLQIGFHWIFVLVGGLLFLLIFFAVISQVLRGDDARNTRELGYAVETILKTALSSPDTFNIAELPGAEYEFACQYDGAEFTNAYVRINDGDFDQDALRYVPLFSADRLRGDELFTSSHSWSAPFPIGNLVALSNNRTRYVYVAPNNDINKVYEFLRAANLGAFNTQVVSTSAIAGIEDTGYDAYRFVFVNTGFVITEGGNSLLPRWEPRQLRKITAVQLDTDDFETGSATFYDDVARPGSVRYPLYGRALFVGAVFATHDEFTCNRRKLLERLESALMILAERLDALDDDGCEDLYDDVRTQFSNYRTYVAAGNLNPVLDAGPASPITRLEDLNRRALSRQCALVY